MESVDPRPIKAEECLAIQEAFAVAAKEVEAPQMALLSKLQVVCRCTCGCASVGFVPEPLEASLTVTVVADAEGYSSAGEPVGFMVWGTPEQITSIEVYWFHSEGAPLPKPGSMRPYETPSAK